MSVKGVNLFYYLSRCLLGLSFLLSAVLKFISLDSFETYVFSLDFCGLVLSSFLSRGLLLVEAFLGIMLMTTMFRKKVDLASFSLLAFFSVFLIYLIVIGEDGNCHCMGETFSFSPIQSLCKNVLFFILLCFATKSPEFPIKKTVLWTLLVFVVSAVFAFVKLPIGIIPPKETKFNEELYVQLEKRHEDLQVLRTEDRVAVCLFSVKCKHCKAAMRKLEVCRKESSENIPIQWIVWGDDEGLEKFLAETSVQQQPYFFLEPIQLMPITEFNIPLFLFFEKGKVVGKMSNATFDEDLCRKFFMNEKK